MQPADCNKRKGAGIEYTPGCRSPLKAQVQQVEKVEPSIRKNAKTLLYFLVQMIVLCRGGVVDDRVIISDVEGCLWLPRVLINS